MRAFGAYLERDQNGAVVGFSGLTLRPTAHTFVVGGRRLHTWRAWDALFLPVMLATTAREPGKTPILMARCSTCRPPSRSAAGRSRR